LKKVSFTAMSDPVQTDELFSTAPPSVNTDSFDKTDDNFTGKPAKSLTKSAEAKHSKRMRSRSLDFLDIIDPSVTAATKKPRGRRPKAVTVALKPGKRRTGKGDSKKRVSSAVW